MNPRLHPRTLKPIRTATLCLALSIIAVPPCAPTAFAAQSPPVSDAKTLYTCGMHPQVLQDHPGDCPICGMKLTPVRRPDGTAPSTILIDPATTQEMNLRTGVVTRGPLRRTVRTVAAIDYDETSLADVTTRFKGWITKLYVDATGQQVHKGDPLFEIYSPDLYSAQADYLLALQNAGSMKAGAKARLMNFNISEDQIAELEKTKQVRQTLVITAPRDGIVVEKHAVEGQMADGGMTLYRIADLSLVWVRAQIYEQDLPFIRLGQTATVTLSYLPDREFVGRVTFIYPTVDEKTRTIQVRMEFHNPGGLLKPGMFATVELEAELDPAALLVPASAVLRSGERNTVFVALDGGHFEARTVALGPRSKGDLYQVLSGLSEGERVVTSGQFLLDSESQLQEAIQKMTAPGATATGRSEKTSATVAPAPAAAMYVCPMPEHASVRYDHPGACPLCGMTLVATAEPPVSEPAIRYYTCPMSEDADVREPKPGKCPRCGMTLIPVTKAP